MPDQSIARSVLSVWGAKVEAVPTSEKEESDWFATLDGFRLLIEEKTKLENPDQVAERNLALEFEGVHGTTTSLGPNNRISGIVRKAERQLISTAMDLEPDARVVWLTSVGLDREAKDRQAYSTLYGATKVFNLDVSKSMRDCFFFHNSDFFRYNKLDGAFLATANKGAATIRLCLNPFSERWSALRDSPFASKLNSGLVDPIAREAAGKAMIADTDIDRRNPDAVLDYLRLKYGIKRLCNMDMIMASATVSIPNER
jgi:hypothetical protein